MNTTFSLFNLTALNLIFISQKNQNNMVSSVLCFLKSFESGYRDPCFRLKFIACPSYFTCANWLLLKAVLIGRTISFLPLTVHVWERFNGFCGKSLPFKLFIKYAAVTPGWLNIYYKKESCIINVMKTIFGKKTKKKFN